MTLKCCSRPSGAWVTMWPATTDATPPDSCWIEALMALKDPRCVAGHIVTQAPDGRLQHFSVIGYVVVATSLVALGLVWRLQRAMADGVPAPV